LQATENYLEALAVLEKKETSPEIWDTINFELSGIYFTIASLLQDNHPSDPIVSREQVTLVYFLIKILISRLSQ